MSYEKKVRILRTGDEIRAANTARKNFLYRENRPDLQVRSAAKEYLSKKRALTEGEDSSELLENLLVNIRNILTGEGIEQIKARRQSEK